MKLPALCLPLWLMATSALAQSDAAQEARDAARETLEDVRQAMGLVYK